MSTANFKTTVLAETKDFGKFELSPLEKGYGLTLGNALRRVLLTSLAGAAVTSVSIDGVTHQFTTLAGMKEDVVEFLLNLKQVRFSYEAEKPAEAKISATGPAKIKAGDIKGPATLSVINKDLVLATLADKKTSLSASLEISTGFGYQPAKEAESAKLGQISLDASFSPVVRVNYAVETSRVGRRTDLDKLILEIYTDGTIKPKKALHQAAQILIDQFNQIINPTFAATEEVAVPLVLTAEDNGVLRLSVEELDLPTRIANALKKGGYATVKDLAEATKDDLNKVKNLGAKSVEIIIKKLQAKGIKVK